MNILVYANSPTAPTGFGTVIRNVFRGITERGRVPVTELNFFGVNYHGEPHEEPFKIWPAQTFNMHNDNDPFGRARFVSLVLSNRWPIDVLFCLEDHFTLAWPIPFPDGRIEPFLPGLLRRMREQLKEGRPPFRVIQYIPVDCDTLLPEWVSWIPDLVDYPVAYCHYGRRTLLDLVPRLSSNLSVIYHGTNPETFFPIAEEERQRYRREVFRCEPEQLLVLNVNRNQPRKDMARSVQVFAEALREVPNAKLYLHCNVQDGAGINLDRVRLNMRVPEGAVLFPANFNEGNGIPWPALNMVYNAADVFLTTSRGEGWGLPITESMLAGRACIALDHTSHTEILAEGRGVLVPPSLVRECMVLDNNQMRPVADVRATAAALTALLRDSVWRAQVGTRAREWAARLSWRDVIVPQWEQVFLDAHRSLQVKAPAVSAGFALNAGASV